LEREIEEEQTLRKHSWSISRRKICKGGLRVKQTRRRWGRSRVPLSLAEGREGTEKFKVGKLEKIRG